MTVRKFRLFLKIILNVASSVVVTIGCKKQTKGLRTLNERKRRRKGEGEGRKMGKREGEKRSDILNAKILLFLHFFFFAFIFFLFCFYLFIFNPFEVSMFFYVSQCLISIVFFFPEKKFFCLPTK